MVEISWSVSKQYNHGDIPPSSAPGGGGGPGQGIVRAMSLHCRDKTYGRVFVRLLIERFAQMRFYNVYRSYEDLEDYRQNLLGKIGYWLKYYETRFHGWCCLGNCLFWNVFYVVWPYSIQISIKIQSRHFLKPLFSPALY